MKRTLSALAKLSVGACSYVVYSSFYNFGKGLNFHDSGTVPNLGLAKIFAMQSFITNCETNNTGSPDSNNNSKHNFVLEVKSDDFKSLVLNSKKDVVIVFYAPWCGYCRRLSKKRYLFKFIIL